MTPEEKKIAIRNGVAEVIGDSVIDDLIDKGEKITVYWGTAPTGAIHIGYLIPLIKVAQLLKIGCRVIIFIADLHASLDSLKSTPDQIEVRVEYYERSISALLDCLGVNMDNSDLQFIRGSQIQQTQAYFADLYRLIPLVSIRNAQKAGTEVVKQDQNPCVGSLIYPLMQSLDQVHLGAMIQLGGVDQRKIFAFAVDHLGKIGYDKLAFLMNPMLPGLQGNDAKMSASDPNSKIDVLCSEKSMRKRVNKIFCVEGEVESNPALKVCELIIFPLLYTGGETTFTIHRKEEYGGDLVIKDMEHLRSEFQSGALHPGDLKNAMGDVLTSKLSVIRQDEYTLDLARIAYPKGDY